MAFICHDADFNSHLVISKIRKNPSNFLDAQGKKVKSAEDYYRLITIEGKPVHLVYEGQDFSNEAAYQDIEQLKNSWLIAEGEHIVNWQIKGSIGTITHICASDTKLDFGKIIAKGQKRIENDKVYDRQHDACPHPVMDIVLPKKDIAELNKMGIWLAYLLKKRLARFIKEYSLMK